MLAILTAVLQLGAAVAHGVTSSAEAFGTAGAYGIGGNPALMLVVVGALAAMTIAVAASTRVPIAEPDPAAAAYRDQTVDRSRLLAQSDPDAPGRTRPRAPTRGLAAA